jgi:hypothetical protein
MPFLELQDPEQKYKLPLKTFKQSSSVLSKVKDFLPLIHQQNQLLNPQLDNIENVNEEQEHIEMNLDLGVLDVELESTTKDLIVENNSIE